MAQSLPPHFNKHNWIKLQVKRSEKLLSKYPSYHSTTPAFTTTPSVDYKIFDKAYANWEGHLDLKTPITYGDIKALTPKPQAQLCNARLGPCVCTIPATEHHEVHKCNCSYMFDNATIATAQKYDIKTITY